jgi:hypothetical protein
VTSNKVPALQAQSPEFNHSPTKKRKRYKENSEITLNNMLLMNPIYFKENINNY